MPAFTCKQCREEYFTFDAERAACEKCGTMNDALHVRRDESRGRGEGILVGRMTEEDLNRRLGLPQNPPKGSGGMGCVVGIVIVIVIGWLLTR